MNCLILGDGLLGSEIQAQTRWPYISRKSNGFDFNNLYLYEDYLDPYQTILNCIGHTDTYSKERELHWKTNYISVCYLTDYCRKHKKKLIHISSDYIYANSNKPSSEDSVPVHAENWYSYTKLLGDAYVQGFSEDYLLIRTSFKPKPFPYEKALVNQIGNFDYVDKISEIIIGLINEGKSGVYNVGTKRKTIYELAVKTNPDVEPWFGSIDDTMPYNITMDLRKLNE